MSSATISYNPNAHFDIEVHDLTYRADKETDWPVRVYQPKGDGPFPALLDVHGGAWSSGTHLNNERIDRELAESGLVVAAIEFRLGPVHKYPAQTQDVNYGIRWLKKNAARFKADPATVGALGTSSGGHSLMITALKPNDPQFAALTLDGGADIDAALTYVLTGWPVLDPLARYQYAKTSGNVRLAQAGEGYFQTEAAMQEGSAQHILERGEQTALPPALILQGTNDDNVPLEISEKFEAAYRAAGGAIQREVFPGMPHAFTREPGPESTRAVALMKEFIARQLRS